MRTRSRSRSSVPGHEAAAAHTDFNLRR
jgi:hypothetical protein